MKIKLSAGIIMLLISVTIPGFSQQWEIQNSPCPNNINDIAFRNEATVFIVGENGLLLSTIDGGDNWEDHKLLSSADLNSVYFLDEMTGYIAGDSGKIFKTELNGTAWEDISIEPYFQIKDIIFKDNENGIAAGTKEVGIDGRKYFLPSIHVTTNAGMSWDEKRFDERGKLNSAAYLEEEVIFAVGDSGKFIKSFDGGNTWNSFSLNLTTNLTDIKVLPDYSIVISGEKGILLFSFDFGERWYAFSIPEYYNLNSISYKDDKQITAAGTKEVWIDGRKYYMATILNLTPFTFEWIEEFSEARGEYNSISFYRPDLAFAAGDSGAVVSFNKITSALSGNNNDFTLADNYNLVQNYPNPFNPSTVINYRLAAGGYVTIKVYDVLGREVATLVNEEKSAGVYEIEFNAGNLSSGIYFYRIEATPNGGRAGDFIQTKKMILLR